MTLINNCDSHDWQNDPIFENGVVEMFTSMQGKEMRQFCSKCGIVRYIPKGEGEK